MSTFVTYLTVYSGDKLPPYYVGSTSAKRLASGYHGSPRSEKYRKIWETELKINPQLFETQQLTEHSTSDDALDMEIELQVAFDAVRSDDFVNMAYARKGFVNQVGSWSEKVKDKMRKPKNMTAEGLELRASLNKSIHTGRKRSEETLIKMRAAQQIAAKKRVASLTPEQRLSLGNGNRGKTWSEARRAAHNSKVV